MGTRAVQHQPSQQATNKRQNPYDQDEQDGIIGGYYWMFGTQTAYNAFDSIIAEDDDIGNDVANYMANGNWIAACTDLSDSAGLLDDGVVAVGWNDQPFEWSSQVALENEISACNLGSIEHGGTVPGVEVEDNV